MIMGTSTKILPAIFSLCLLSVNAFGGDRYQISVARMPERATADVSYNLFATRVKAHAVSIATALSAGIGAVRWDNDRNGEGRLHVDASLSINRVHFSIGPFVTSGKRIDQAALGLRTALGYKSRNSIFVGGYWEVTAGLPAERGTRAGGGIQVGIGF